MNHINDEIDLILAGKESNAEQLFSNILELIRRFDGKDSITAQDFENRKIMQKTKFSDTTNDEIKKLVRETLEKMRNN